jgi:hypothetical protein
MAKISKWWKFVHLRRWVIKLLRRFKSNIQTLQEKCKKEKKIYFTFGIQSTDEQSTDSFNSVADIFYGLMFNGMSWAKLVSLVFHCKTSLIKLLVFCKTQTHYFTKHSKHAISFQLKTFSITHQILRGFASSWVISYLVVNIFVLIEASGWVICLDPATWIQCLKNYYPQKHVLKDAA